MAKLVVGCGYLGQRVAARWLAAGQTVYGLTRSSGRARHFRGLGFCPLVGDWTRPESLPEFPDVDTLLCSVGWDRSAGQTIGQVYVGGLRNLLAVLPAGLGRLVYISSTGVYGESRGEWVDEQTPCRPRRAGGQACLDAEQLLVRSGWGERTIILRLAGLYGPGRLPRQRDLVTGRPLATDPEGTLNLIHVEDAVTAVLRAEQVCSMPLPRTFVISDGHPVRRRDFYDELTRLLGTPSPAYVPPDPTLGGSNRRMVGAKRVRNWRMVEELGVTPQYGSYREGLAAIVAAGG